MAERRRFDPRRFARLRPRELAFAGAIVLFVLAALEAFLRWFPFPREPYEDFYDDIYDVGYAMVPGAVNPYSDIREKINGNGFRGAEYAETKPEGAFRILCLGDSCTFGYGVRQDESYPAQLERVLRERLPGRRIEVINAGVPGTCLYQHLLMLEKKLVRFRPDLVLVWSPPCWAKEIHAFRERAERPPWTARLRGPLRRLALYRFLLRAIKKGPTERAYFEAKEAMSSGLPGPGMEVILEDYVTDLARLDELAVGHGFEPVFLNYPMRDLVLSPTYPPPGYNTPFHKPLLVFCQRRGYLHIDLIAAQRPVARADFFIDSAHPGPAGHAFIARVIADALLSAGKIPWVPDPR